MTRSLRERLKRLEKATPKPELVIMTAAEHDRLPPERRKALDEDPNVTLVVIDTGIDRCPDEPPCA